MNSHVRWTAQGDLIAMLENAPLPPGRARVLLSTLDDIRRGVGEILQEFQPSLTKIAKGEVNRQWAALDDHDKLFAIVVEICAGPLRGKTPQFSEYFCHVARNIVHYGGETPAADNLLGMIEALNDILQSLANKDLAKDAFVLALKQKGFPPAYNALYAPKMKQCLHSAKEIVTSHIPGAPVDQRIDHKWSTVFEQENLRKVVLEVCSALQQSTQVALNYFCHDATLIDKEKNASGPNLLTVCKALYEVLSEQAAVS